MYIGSFTAHPFLATRERRSRAAARRLPQLGESFLTASDAAGVSREDSAQSSTPYRLPKLSRNDVCIGVDQEGLAVGAVYSRYGYCNHSPYYSSQDFDQAESAARVFPGPTFRQAVMAPIWSPLMEQQSRRPCGTQEEVAERATKLPSRSKTSLTLFSAFGSTIPRGPSVLGGWPRQEQQLQQQPSGDAGAGADADGTFGTGQKPVQWVMRPQRSFQVDRKGQQRNQGPFSREFTVHARAPQNWLKMKWGRPTTQAG